MWFIAVVAQAHTFPPIITAGSPVTALGYGPSVTADNPDRSRLCQRSLFWMLGVLVG